MAAPSWLATQPPTPITSAGFCCFSERQAPSSENTFSWAFSRIEQVFSRITSASSGFSVSSRAWCSPSRSAMRELSYSFIWQPWVWMKSFLAMDLVEE
ncbi:hypothetical protein D9M68_872930 [compost metagenome]